MADLLLLSSKLHEHTTEWGFGMKIRLGQLRNRGGSAFALVDVVIAMGLAGIMFVSLFAGLGFGFNIIKLARENLRATQIMVEKMETIRLYTWDQVNSNGFIPRTFVTPYYPIGSTNTGVLYTGTVVIADSPIGASYGNDMKMVTVNLNWSTGKLPRNRTMSTFISRYGLQNYIYDEQ